MIKGIVRGIGQRLRRSRLSAQWSEAERAGRLDKRIPPPAINYNIEETSSLEAYQRCFISAACLKELPALLEIVGYSPSRPTFTMLDYGCGLGRMAYAFSNLFGADPTRRHIGYEIHPDAYQFLSRAYAAYPNVEFLTDKIDVRESYVELQASPGVEVGRDSRSKVQDVTLAGRVTSKIDLQFSHSVFTHMYRDSIVHALKDFALMASADGCCINSWLIVDEFAEASLRAGLADRQLPHRVDGFYTYSLENPLLCSAYPYEMMKTIYEDAGHEIVSVLFGSWSGRKPGQVFTYQDIVVSRPRPSAR